MRDRLAPWLLFVTLLLGLPGCSCDEDDAGGATPSEPTTAPGPEQPASAEPAPSGEPEPVDFQTADGVRLRGTLRRGGRPDAPAAILVHQLGGSRAEWAPVVDALAEAPGLTVLAFDTRGHGESTQRADGTAIAFRDFGRPEWADTAKDVTAALAYLRSIPGLSPSRLVVVGSSIGGTAAITAAADDPAVTAVALLSPGRAYHGFDAMTPASRFGRPMLVLTAQGEGHSVETGRVMAQIGGATRFVPLRGAGHGLAMLQDGDGLLRELVPFVRGVEPAGGEEPAPAPEAPTAGGGDGS